MEFRHVKYGFFFCRQVRWFEPEELPWSRLWPSRRPSYWSWPWRCPPTGTPGWTRGAATTAGGTTAPGAKSLSPTRTTMPGKGYYTYTPHILQLKDWKMKTSHFSKLAEISLGFYLKKQCLINYFLFQSSDNHPRSHWCGQVQFGQCPPRPRQELARTWVWQRVLQSQRLGPQGDFHH